MNIVPFFGFSQASVIVEYNRKEISTADTFSISITYSNALLKSVSHFPEIADFEKNITTFKKDKDRYLITQIYFPIKAGDFYLAPYFLSINGIKYQFKGFQGRVLQAKFGKKSTRAVDKDTLGFNSIKEDAFFRVSVNKAKIFVGEGFQLDVALYIGKNNKAEINFIDLQYQLQKILAQVKPSKAWVEQMVTPEKMVSDSINMNGIPYFRHLFYSGIFYPLNPGAFEVPEVNLKLLKYKIRKSPHMIERRGEYVYLPSKKINIKVTQPPDHPLKDQVAVGDYQLEEMLKTKVVTSGKAFQYQFIIKSKLGSSSIPLPIVRENQIFNIFAPKISTKQEKSGMEIVFIKIFEYSIVSHHHGVFPLDSLFQWVFFNTKRLKYDTLISGLDLKIEKGEANEHLSPSIESTFYKEMIGKASNRLRSKEKEDRIKLISNLAILLMLVLTIILLFKK